MRDVTVFILLCLYTLLLVYAGFFAQYRDIEDLYNQFSHVAISCAVLCHYFISSRNIQFERINKWFSLTLVILNIAELADEYRKGNFRDIEYKDYLFPVTTLIIALFIIWKTSKRK